MGKPIQRWSPAPAEGNVTLAFFSISGQTLSHWLRYQSVRKELRPSYHTDFWSRVVFGSFLWSSETSKSQHLSSDLLWSLSLYARVFPEFSTPPRGWQLTVFVYSPGGVQNFRQARPLVSGSPVIFSLSLLRAICTVTVLKLPNLDGTLPLGDWNFERKSRIGLIIKINERLLTQPFQVVFSLKRGCC